MISLHFLILTFSWNDFQPSEVWSCWSLAKKMISGYFLICNSEKPQKPDTSQKINVVVLQMRTESLHSVSDELEEFEH